MHTSAPVAFLIFNRPDLTAKVFDAIAAARPRKLLVVADGPRNPEEAERCRASRAVLERVNWDCEVLTRFSEKNLGCGPCVSSGLDWVFSEVEEAIIVEDDALPAASFFPFCETLLERYRHDTRVMHISSTTMWQGNGRYPYSYYFGRSIFGCAWGTWRRAWKTYDYDMKLYGDLKKAGMLEFIFDDSAEAAYWTPIFENMSSDEAINTWDYQWVFNCWAQSGLAISPTVNLYSNLGFRADATHTTAAEHIFANRQLGELWEIDHPSSVVRNKEADDYNFHHLWGREMRGVEQPAPASARIRQRLASLRTRMIGSR